MGTRGFLGFVAEDTEKITYNHFDSYPSGLGINVLTWLRAASDSLTAVRERIVALRVVDGESEPTEEDIERLRKYANTRVSNQRLNEWYVLLRETQGDPHAILDAGVIEDGSDFPADSLFAEYGYMVDLDAGAFEAYIGFQQGTHDKGRFAKREGREGYAPVALAASWPLTELPTDEEFLAALGEDDES
jgi:hypothetical protein